MTSVTIYSAKLEVTCSTVGDNPIVSLNIGRDADIDRTTIFVAGGGEELAAECDRLGLELIRAAAVVRAKAPVEAPSEPDEPSDGGLDAALKHVVEDDNDENPL